MASRRSTESGGAPLLLALVLALSASSTANADLVPFDHPNPLLAKITLDTDTGLHWLDVTESTGFSYADVEVGVGGFIAAGWRHATIGEVCALFERYLVPSFPPAMSCPIIGFDFPTTVTPASATFVLQMMGSTGYDDGLGNSGTYGLASGSSVPEAGSVMFGNPSYYAGVTQNPGDTLTSTSPTIGHYLVRVGAPAPVPGLAGWSIAGVASLLVAAALRRRRACAGSPP